MFRIFDQYVSRKTGFVVVGDALSIVGSIILGYKIRFWTDPESFAFYTQQPDLTLRCLTILAVFQICAYYNELYRAQDQLSASDQFFRLTQATGVGCFFLAAIYYAAPQLSIGRSVFAMTLVCLLASTTLLRWLADLAWRTAHHPTRQIQLSWSAVAIVGGLIALLYWDVVPGMAYIWWTDEAYSHGLLIPPLAAYVAWLNRDRILAAPASADSRGLIVTGAGCAMHLLGRLGAEFFLTRVSLVVILAGIILTYWGVARLQQMSFSLVLLATMVPIPAIVYNKLAAPLQLFASWVASNTLEMLGIPIFRDGNVMHLSDISLGVAEACSGLRSISSLSVLALVLGYFICTSLPIRTFLFFLAFPVAIGVNVLRIVITALFAREDPALAEGFFHSFSGWVVFLVGFGFMYLLATVLARFESPRYAEAGEESP